MRNIQVTSRFARNLSKLFSLRIRVLGIPDHGTLHSQTFSTNGGVPQLSNLDFVIFVILSPDSSEGNTNWETL